MDVEKTIAFLLAEQAGTHERIARLENAQAQLTNAQAQLAITMNQLADRQIHLDETLDRFVELTTEGFKRMDKRISELVSSVGALIGKMPPFQSQ